MKQKIQRLLTPFQEFLQLEASSGMVLLACAILAMILANSPLAHTYEHILHLELGGGVIPKMGLAHWINDGLMAVFFFTIGLEIKREFLYGELKNRSAMILPVGAALGGMLVPAIFYALINYGEPTAAGWGIPMATDIAFALGIMTIAAKNAPLGLVVFLTALAIVDDLGAIVVIALFYSTKISLTPLLVGLLAISVALWAGRRGSRSIIIYILLGLMAWYDFLEAGIHPTIAGVLLGFAMPASQNPAESFLHKLEHKLEPWSAYVIMPIFALANAGVTISPESFSLSSPVFLGIVAGLCLGKPIGIFGSVWLFNKLGKVPLPGQAKSGQVFAAGSLGGIGFTMSIFIASLAFADATTLALAKISILTASILSGIIGALLFNISQKYDRI